MMRVALAIGCVGWLTACASAAHPSTPSAHIAKIADVKSDFGPQFHVTNVAPTGIDPKILATQNLPEGLTFEPADCAKIVTAAGVPPGVQGNMAAVAAEGDGNRFIAIAVETSKPVPFTEPGSDCKKVGFTGAELRGVVETVEAPQIAGARTLGVHRVVQAVIAGRPTTGEIYDYSAHFDDYQVIITANSLILPGKPVVAVDTQRARSLLSASVAAVRS